MIATCGLFVIPVQSIMTGEIDHNAFALFVEQRVQSDSYPQHNKHHMTWDKQQILEPHDCPTWNSY